MDGIKLMAVSIPDVENTRTRTMIDALEHEPRVYLDPDDENSDFFVILMVTSTETVRDPETGETAAQKFLALHVTAQNALDTALYANNTVSNIVLSPASASTAGTMSAADFAKLRDIAAGANLYIHPVTHPASIIVQDENHRFLTDEQIANMGADTGDLSAIIASIQTQLARLTDSIYEDLTDNPWSVTFDSLTGLAITGFVWNKTSKRLEV